VTAGVRARLRALRYAGRLVTCPVCRGEFRAFPGDARSCPQCESRPRQRLLWLFLSESGLLRPGAAVLHFAPERALERRVRDAGVAYTSTDIEPGAAMVQADATALPFEDAGFDLALCSHVLEHVADDRAAMAELRRVLRPGGTAVVQSPVNYAQPATYEDPSIVEAGERCRHFSQRDHVRVYGPDLRTRLEEAGFHVTIVDAQERGAADVERLGLGAPEGLRNDLYRCDTASA
jgi:SAM-dependent methyltransferase